MGWFNHQLEGHEISDWKEWSNLKIDEKQGGRLQPEPSYKSRDISYNPW